VGVASDPCFLNISRKIKLDGDIFFRSRTWSNYVLRKVFNHRGPHVEAAYWGLRTEARLGHHHRGDYKIYLSDTNLGSNQCSFCGGSISCNLRITSEVAQFFVVYNIPE
jgi:hypothetical protein